MLFFYEGNSLKSGIYEIRNRISNKSYIGSAKEFKARWVQHKNSLLKKKHQNKYFQKSFNKYFQELNKSNFLEFHVLEIMENSTKQQRLLREEHWISEYLNYNIELYNKELNPTREKREFEFKHSLNSIKQMKKRNKGKNNPMYGKKHTLESKLQISLTKKNLIQTGQLIPKKHSKEYKEKLKINNPGGKATSKSILQIDINGNVVTTWPSTRQAGFGLGIKSWRNISNSANKNKNRVVGGFYWRWPDDPDVVNNKLLNFEKLNLYRTKKVYGNYSKIQQLSVDGIIITIWNNMCEAARKLNIKNSGISAAIKNNKPYKGYYWKKIL